MQKFAFKLLLTSLAIKRRSKRIDGAQLVASLMLGLIGLAGFLWSLKNGQYDDLEGAGWRAIADDEPAPEKKPP